MVNFGSDKKLLIIKKIDIYFIENKLIYILKSDKKDWKYKIILFFCDIKIYYKKCVKRILIFEIININCKWIEWIE